MTPRESETDAEPCRFDLACHAKLVGHLCANGESFMESPVEPDRCVDEKMVLRRLSAKAKGSTKEQLDVWEDGEKIDCEVNASSGRHEVFDLDDIILTGDPM